MRTSNVNLRDFVSGVILTLAGLYITFGESVVMGKTFGVDSMPLVARADFYIRALGIALLAMSIMLVVRSLRHPGSGEKKTIPRVAIIGAAALIVFNLVLDFLGFFISATLLIALWTFLFRIKEYHIARSDRPALVRSAVISVVFALISVAVLQASFTYFLGVRLP